MQLHAASRRPAAPAKAASGSESSTNSARIETPTAAETPTTSAPTTVMTAVGLAGLRSSRSNARQREGSAAASSATTSTSVFFPEAAAEAAASAPRLFKAWRWLLRWSSTARAPARGAERLPCRRSPHLLGSRLGERRRRRPVEARARRELVGVGGAARHRDRRLLRRPRRLTAHRQRENRAMLSALGGRWRRWRRWRGGLGPHP